MNDLQPLFGQNLQCPLCLEKFISLKVRSKFIKVQKYDTDFCPIYEDESIFGLLYNVFVCPHCGYSYTNDFSNYFPPSTKEAIQEKICSKWISRDYGTERSIQDAIRIYKLASYSATLKKEKHIIIAGIYLRIAWLYRFVTMDEQENRFLKLAIHEYIESYSREDYKGTKVSEIRILYLLGDLSRRVGNRDQAVKYLSMVIEKQKQTHETKIIELAKSCWHEIREQKSHS